MDPNGSTNGHFYGDKSPEGSLGSPKFWIGDFFWSQKTPRSSALSPTGEPMSSLYSLWHSVYSSLFSSWILWMNQITGTGSPRLENVYTMSIVQEQRWYQFPTNHLINACYIIVYHRQWWHVGSKSRAHRNHPTSSSKIMQRSSTNCAMGATHEGDLRWTGRNCVEFPGWPKTILKWHAWEYYTLNCLKLSSNCDCLRVLLDGRAQSSARLRC